MFEALEPRQMLAASPLATIVDPLPPLVSAVEEAPTNFRVGHFELTTDDWTGKAAGRQVKRDLGGLGVDSGLPGTEPTKFEPGESWSFRFDQPGLLLGIQFAEFTIEDADRAVLVVGDLKPIEIEAGRVQRGFWRPTELLKFEAGDTLEIQSLTPTTALLQAAAEIRGAQQLTGDLLPGGIATPPRSAWRIMGLQVLGRDDGSLGGYLDLAKQLKAETRTERAPLELTMGPELPANWTRLTGPELQRVESVMPQRHESLPNGFPGMTRLNTPDIDITSFTVAQNNVARFSVSYVVNNGPLLQNFVVKIYRSYDGSNPVGDALLTSDSIQPASSGSVEIDVNFPDVNEDYYLLAKIEGADNTEIDSTPVNNKQTFYGGIFLDQYDLSIHFHGALGSYADEVEAASYGGGLEGYLYAYGNDTYYYSGQIRDIRIRSHGGNDTIDVDNPESVGYGMWAWGGDGNDVIYGNPFSSWLYGGKGADHLYGRGGDDHIFAGDPNWGAGEGDYLFGGEGNDTILGGGLADWIDGGNGIDGIYGGNELAQFPNEPWDPGYGTGGGGYFDYGGGDHILGGSGADAIDGQYGNDFINGDNDNDTIAGGGDNDYLIGGGGQSTIDGGAGDDILEGHNENDTLKGGAGADQIYGHGGDDKIFGGIGNDDLYGLGGNDALFGEEGADSIQGGDGSDVIYGGDGNDPNLSGGSGDDIIYAGPGNDFRVVGDDGDDQLFGSEGDDVLSGGAGADRLDGGGGDDQLTGGADDDTYIVSNRSITDVTISDIGGTDTLDLSDWIGEIGATVVLSNSQLHSSVSVNILVSVGNSIENAVGTPVDDILIGSALANLLQGGAGDDLLYGGGGDDRLEGGIGDDRLYGISGDDTLLGGLGSDTYYLPQSAGTFSIDETDTDIDVFDFSSWSSGVALDLGKEEQTIGQATLRLIDDRKDGGRVEKVIGSDHADSLWASSLGSVLLGGIGDDKLYGREGDDWLEGGTESDQLSGGGGNDVLLGQAAYDVLEVADNADDPSAYTESGIGWSDSAFAGGFNRGQRTVAPGGATHTATWMFDDLPDGEYEVHVTWEPDPEDLGSGSVGATNTSFEVDANGSPVPVDDVNQRTRPSYFEDGVYWHRLLIGGNEDTRFSVDDGSLEVTLSNADANGRVYADAVRVVKINHAPDIVSVDLETTGGTTVIEDLEFSIDAADDLSIKIEASDSDVVTIELADNSPAGVTITSILEQPGAARLEWDAEDRPEGVFAITFYAIDNGLPKRTTIKTIYINLGAANQAPEITGFSNIVGGSSTGLNEFSAEEGQVLEFDVTKANDDSSTLKFSRSPDAPAGAIIHEVTGHFSWKPTVSDVAIDPHIFEIRLTDNGNPPLRDRRLISITVTNDVNTAPIVSAPVLMHDTGAQNGATADPRVYGTVTNDGPLDFVEIEVDYGYVSGPFVVDDIVQVVAVDGQPWTGQYVVSPSNFDLLREGGGTMPSNFSIAVRAREWDPVAEAYVLIPEFQVTDFEIDPDENSPPTLSVNLLHNFADIAQVPASTDPTISGTVSNADGSQEAMLVKIYDANPALTVPELIAEVHTDSAGHFTYVPAGLVVPPEDPDGRISVFLEFVAVESTAVGDVESSAEPLEFEFVRNMAPSIEALGLEETSDAIDPVITGWIDNPYGPVEGITIEFDDNADLIVDGVAVTDEDGHFVYLPVHMAASGTAVINARAVEWDAYQNTLLVGDWLDGSSATEPLTLTEAARTNSAPLIDTFRVKYDRNYDGSPVSNPTLSGTVTNDNGLGGIVVEFSHAPVNASGRFDDIIGLAITDEQGYFEFLPVGLEPGIATSIYAQAIEWDLSQTAGNELIDFDDEEAENPLTVTVSAEPLQAGTIPDFGLEFDTDVTTESTPSTSDPTIMGTVPVSSYDGDLTEIVVEFDHDGNGTVDGTATPDEDGQFRYLPLGLNTGQPTVPVTIKARLRVPDYTVRPPEFDDDLLADDWYATIDDNLVAAKWYVSGYDYTTGDWEEMPGTDDDVHDWLESVLPGDGEAFAGNWYNSDFIRGWDSLFDDYTTSWNYAVTFKLDLNDNNAPALDDDGQDPLALRETNQLMNPTVVGRIEDDGRVAGLTVRFYIDGNSEPDGSAITDDEGNFVYTLRGHNSGANQINVRVEESEYGSPDPIERDLGNFTITVAGNAAITVALLGLRNGSDNGGTLTAIDPTIIGSVGGFDNPALRTVEFDFDGDGIPEDRALTDGLGAFTFTPEGIDSYIVSGQLTVRARAVERFVDAATRESYNTFGAWNGELTWNVETNAPPIIDQFELAYDTGNTQLSYQVLDRVTTDPTLVGRVVDDNAFAFVTVEFDHYGSDEIEAIDGTAITDENGYFRYTPQGLTLGAWDIRARVREYNPVTASEMPSVWAPLTADGDPTTPSLSYGFTLVEPTAATITLLEHPEHPLLEGQNDYDPTIVGTVEDDDTTSNLIVEFFLSGSTDLIGSTLVNPDGTFEFTPVGLEFTEGTPHEITASVKEWDYSAGSYMAGTSTAMPASLHFLSTLSHSELSAFAVQGFGQSVAGSQLDPTVTATVDIPSTPVGGVNFDLVTVLYVEIKVGDEVTIVPVEAVPSATNPQVVEYRFTYRPSLESSATPVTIEARPVGLDQYGYVFGNWQETQVTYNAHPPSINGLGLVSDYVNDPGPEVVDSVDPTIEGTATAPLVAGPDAQPRVVEFDFDNDGSADDSIEVTANDYYFAYTFEDLTSGAVIAQLRAVRFETIEGGGPDGEDRIERIEGDWQELKFELLTSLPRVTLVELANETGGTEPLETTDPTIDGKVKSYAAESVSGMTVEVDHNSDGVPDGTTIVRSDGSFTYKPRNLQPGPVSLQVRAVDPFTSSQPLVGEWTAFTCQLLSIPTPSITDIKLAADEDDGETDESSNPTLVGTVTRHETVSQLIVEFDHDGNGVVDGTAIANLFGEFTYTPANLAYGNVSIRARGVARSGAEVAYGAWSDEFEFVRTSAAPPVIGSLSAHATTGLVVGRGTVGGFGARMTVEIAVATLQGGPLVTNGFVRTDPNGSFQHQLHEMVGGPWLVKARGIIDDGSSGAEVVGEWNVITLEYNPDDVSAPVLTKFELAHDTGSSDSDGQTSDPTLTGEVTPVSPGMVVEFDYDQDNDVDASVAVEPDGTFTHTVPGLTYYASRTIRARWKQWDPISGSYQYVDEPDQPASWNERPAVPFTLKPDGAQYQYAAVEEIEILHDVNGGIGTPRSADPTIVGKIDNDGGRVGGLTVEFDHNSDGVIDGSTLTRVDGSFLYQAIGLTPGAQSIGARVVELNYFGQTLAGPTEFLTFILDDAPLVDGLEFVPSPVSPEVQGEVLSDANWMDLSIEYQVHGNYSEEQLAVVPPPTVIQPPLAVDSNRGFTIDVSALGLGAAVVMVRAVDESGTTPVRGPWKTLEFVIAPTSVVVHDINDFALADDTGQADDGQTNITTVTGVVGLAGAGAFAIVEFDLDGDSEADARTTADSTGRFILTPDESYLPEGVQRTVSARHVAWDAANQTELTQTWSATLAITRVPANGAAWIQGFGLLDDDQNPLTDPTVKGTVQNDGRRAGLRVEFDIETSTQSADGVADGFTYSDQNGNFKFTPYGLAAGDVIVYARVIEWNPVDQGFVPTDLEDHSTTFTLAQDGPTDPEFHEDIEKNLDAIDQVFASFKDAVFASIGRIEADESIDLGTASIGALHVGIGSILMLRRGGADSVSDETEDFSDTVFELIDDQLPTEVDDGNCLTGSFTGLVTSDGGVLNATYIVDRFVEVDGTDISVHIQFSLTDIAYHREIALLPEGPAATEQRSTVIELFDGSYSFDFKFNGSNVGTGPVEIEGDPELTETFDYGFDRTEIWTRDADPHDEIGPTITTFVGSGNYGNNPTGGDNDGNFDEGALNQNFYFEDTIHIETLVDESGTEIIDEDGRRQSRTYHTFEHSIYHEERVNSGYYEVNAAGAQTAVGTLSINAWAQFEVDNRETVAFYNEFSEGAFERGTRSTTDQAAYHGTLVGSVSYVAGESAVGSLKFDDSLQAASTEIGSGNSLDANGNTETWNYQVFAGLGSTAAIVGSFDKTRLTDGGTLSHASTSYSLSSQARIAGSSSGSATFDSVSGSDTIEGDSHGSFSFSSSASATDSGTAKRTNDQVKIVGNAALSYSGTASERVSGSADIITDTENLDSNIHSAAIESLYGSASGSIRVSYTVTDKGQRTSGSANSSVSGSSLRASQVHGTVTEHIDGEDDITTPVRDNEAASYSLSVTHTGQFTSDSLGSGQFGQPAQQTASGHVTRTESSSSRSSNFAGLAGPIDGLPEQGPIFLPAGLGAYNLSKSTFSRDYREDYDYEDDNGSLTRRGTFDETTEATSERSESIPNVTVDAGDTVTTFSLRRDGGGRRDTSSVGSFAEDPAGRQVDSAGDEALENFAADKLRYTTHTNDGAGNRSGSSAASAGKSQHSSTGSGSSSVDTTAASLSSAGGSTDGAERVGPSTFASDVTSRNSGGGSSWSQDAATTDDNGVITVTRNLSTSNGNSRGQLSGDGSGRATSDASGSTSDTDASANQTSRAGGGGAAMTVTVVTNGDAKDTTKTVARGQDAGSANGTASGTVHTDSAGTDSSFDVGGHTDGNNQGSTTRTTTHTDSDSRGRTTVTRSDTAGGNLHSDGTIASEPGSSTSRDGTYSGHADTGAKVELNHVANSDLGDGTFSFGRAAGTLFTDLGGGFNGSWDGAELHADLARKSGEDSTSTDGWRKFVLDANGLVWQGQTTTHTTKTHENASGQADEEEEPGGEESDADAPRAGGSDAVNIHSWDITVDESGVDSTIKDWTSTLTGKITDESTSDTVVNEWTTDIYQTTIVAGALSTEFASKEKGTHSKTLTLRGERQTLDIQRNVKTETNDTKHDPASTLLHFGDGKYFGEWDETADITSDSDNYSYHSSHTVGDQGLAQRGTYRATHDVVHTVGTTASLDKEIHREPSIDHLEYERTRAKYDRTTTLGRHVHERGWYDDVLVAGAARRQMAGTYTITTSYTGEAPRDENYHIYRFEDHDNGQVGVWTNRYSESGTTTKTTTGDFDNSGTIEESTNYQSGRKEVIEFHADDSGGDHLSDVRTATWTPTDDGSHLLQRRVRDIRLVLFTIGYEEIPIPWYDSERNFYIYVDWGVPYHETYDMVEPTLHGTPDKPVEKPVQGPAAEPGQIVVDVEFQSPWASFFKEFGYQSTNMALDEVPYVGEVKAIDEIVTGNDLRGDELSVLEKAGSALTLIPGGGVAKRALAGWGQIGKGIGRAFDGMRGWLRSGDDGVAAANQALRHVDQLPTAQLDALAKETGNLDNAVPPTAGFAEPKTGGPLVPKGAKPLGDWGEARLLQDLGNQGIKPKSPFRTSLGNRYFDRLVDGIAHEAKAGVNAGLTSIIRKQVLKDAELIRRGRIDGAHWHFYQGAQRDLLNFLTQNGIQYTVH